MTNFDIPNFTHEEELVKFFTFFVATFLVLRVTKFLFSKIRFNILPKTKFDDIAYEQIRSFPISIIISIAFLVGYMSLESEIRFQSEIRLVATIINVIIFLVFVRYLNNIIHIVIKELSRTIKDKATEGAYIYTSIIIRSIIWCVGILFILSNIGYDIDALIAGLGIGGVAIALGVRNIVGDLFSSLLIFLDRPIEVGDNIKIGDQKGVVKQIRIRSTLIRDAQSSTIVIPNSDVIAKTIVNYSTKKYTNIQLEIEVKDISDFTEKFMAKVSKKFKNIKEEISNIYITEKNLQSTKYKANILMAKSDEPENIISENLINFIFSEFKDKIQSIKSNVE